MKKISTAILLSLTSICFGQTDLLMTDFQTGMPANYSIVDNDGLTPAAAVSEYTSAWITVQDPDNNLDTVAASTSFFSPVGTADRWMITPALTLGNYGNFINWVAKSQDASYSDDYLVLISTTDNLLASFTDTIGSILQENADWTTRQVDLSALGYNNQTIYVAFVNTTYDGFKLYVDDIHVWKNDPVGIEELGQTLTVEVYPNPTNGIVNVNSMEEINQITLINAMGRTISEANQKQIDLSKQPAGVYFINVETARGVVTKKVIKN